MNIDVQQPYNMNSAGIKPTMVGGSKDTVLENMDITETIGPYLTVKERAKARIVDKNKSMKYIITREEMDKVIKPLNERLQRLHGDMNRANAFIRAFPEQRRANFLAQLELKLNNKNDFTDDYYNSLELLLDEEEKLTRWNERATRNLKIAKDEARTIERKLNNMRKYRDNLNNV